MKGDDQELAMEIANDIILQAKNISKSFGPVKVLENVNFELKKGEVHALLGANGAGKSTLLNIIDGVLTDFEGEIYVDGKQVKLLNPEDARLNGIGMVHQELSVLPNISIAENIYMNRLPKKKTGFVDWKKLYQDSKNVLQSIGMDLDPKMKLGALTVADRQMVEIARIVSMDPPVILLDEPTSALSEAEIRRMLELIVKFKEENRSIVFITHKLDEILAVCDRITVLKDGKLVDIIEVTDRTKQAERGLVKLMISNDKGEEALNNMYPPKSENIGEVTLEVDSLCGAGGFSDVSINARSGEVVVITGLKGSKRTEFLRAVYGADAYTSGTVKLFGKPHKKGIISSIKQGMVMVSEDRKGEGIVPIMAIRDNISLSTIGDCSKFGITNKKKIVAKAEKFVEKLHIKVGSIANPVTSLSGGNQQKVVLAKCMAAKPKIFLMDEPTRGIDIGAKIEIYKLIRSIANEGSTVVVVSSEIPEVMGLADRIYVMREGRVVGELVGDEIENDVIMHMMFGHKK